MGQAYKRTRLWIDPPFQARLLLRMALYLLFYSFIVWQVGFFLDVLQRLAAGSLNRLSFDVYFEFLWQQKSLLVAMIVVTPILLYDLVKFSIASRVPCTVAEP